MNKYIVAVLILALLPLAGCAGVSEAQPGPGGHESGTLAPAPEPPAGRPVRVVTFVDKTGSAPAAACPQPDASAFGELIDVIGTRGGELGVGLICADSNRPLVRLLIPEPPARPALAERANNAFDRRRERLANAELAAAHEAALARWRSGVEARVSGFRTELAAILSTPVACRRTDIWGALARADLYIAEPDPGWSVAPAQYVVLVTDGIHNTTTRPVQLTRNPKLLLVNGAGSVGVLASLDPGRFESLEAAFRFIRHQHGG